MPAPLTYWYRDKKNILKSDDLVIGYEVGPFLEKLGKKSKLAFFEDDKSYYQMGLDYMKTKFPLQDKTLKHAEVANVSVRQSV